MDLQYEYLRGGLETIRNMIPTALRSLIAVREEQHADNIDSIRFSRIERDGNVKVEYLKVIRVEPEHPLDRQTQLSHAVSDQRVRFSDEITPDYAQLLVSYPLTTFLDASSAMPKWYAIQKLTQGVAGFKLSRVVFHSDPFAPNFDLFMQMDERLQLRFTAYSRVLAGKITDQYVTFEIRLGI